MTENPIQRRGNGKIWFAEPDDVYHVTGVDCSGKRFKHVCKTWEHARGYNIWRGTWWLVRDGKRFKIQEAWNG